MECNNSESRQVFEASRKKGILPCLEVSAVSRHSYCFLISGARFSNRSDSLVAFRSILAREGRDRPVGSKL